MKHEDLLNKCKELETYVELMNDEVSETCQNLFSLVAYMSYTSKEFNISLEKEILRQLKYFKDHCTIVEKKYIEEHIDRVIEWIE